MIVFVSPIRNVRIFSRRPLERITLIQRNPSATVALGRVHRPRASQHVRPAPRDRVLLSPTIHAPPIEELSNANSIIAILLKMLRQRQNVRISIPHLRIEIPNLRTIRQPTRQQTRPSRAAHRLLTMVVRKDHPPRSQTIHIRSLRHPIAETTQRWLQIIQGNEYDIRTSSAAESGHRRSQSHQKERRHPAPRVSQGFHRTQSFYKDLNEINPSRTLQVCDFSDLSFAFPTRAVLTCLPLPPIQRFPIR